MVSIKLTVAQVIREIREPRSFYEESGGGVAFSGGEPLGQADVGSWQVYVRAMRSQVNVLGAPAAGP